MEEKPLSNWVSELKQGGHVQWLRFYKNFMGAEPSSIPRFYKVLNLYGFWPTLESIIEASNRPLEGDPLAYISKVAHEKFKASQQQADDDARYQEDIRRAREATTQYTEKMGKRLKPKGRPRKVK